MRVLITDDRPENAEVFAKLIGMLGPDVLAAHGGTQCLDVWTTFRPHVAFVDLTMPTLDGFQVLQRLRSDTSNCPLVIVAISGYGDAEMVTRCRVAGFDLHCLKPLDLPTIKGVLAKGQELLDAMSQPLPYNLDIAFGLASGGQ